MNLDHSPLPWTLTYFTKPDGSEIKTPQDCADTVAFSALQCDGTRLWGVTLAEKDSEGRTLVICYTGNGPHSEANARLIAAAVNALNITQPCGAAEAPAQPVNWNNPANSRVLAREIEEESCGTGTEVGELAPVSVADIGESSSGASREAPAQPSPTTDVDFSIDKDQQCRMRVITDNLGGWLRCQKAKGHTGKCDPNGYEAAASPSAEPAKCSCAGPNVSAGCSIHGIPLARYFNSKREVAASPSASDYSAPRPGEWVQPFRPGTRPDPKDETRVFPPSAETKENIAAYRASGLAKEPVMPLPADITKEQD